MPILRSLFGQTNDEINQSDIVMLLTPHIVRTHELTAEDLSPIFIGTQQNVGLGGPPPLIAPQPVEAPPPAPRAGAGRAGRPGGDRPRRAAPLASRAAGCRRRTRAPPGTSPVPTLYAAARHRGRHGARRQPRRRRAAGDAAAAPSAAGTLPRAEPPTRSERAAAARRAPRAAGDHGAGHHHAAGHGIPRGGWTVHGADFDQQRVARVDADADRHVQPERAARAHGAGRHVHAAGGRDDDASRRASTRRRAASTSPSRAAADQAGASGAGLLAALLFDAVGPGGSMIQVNGVGSTPEGAPVALQFNPVT